MPNSGVIFDMKFNWKTQYEKACEKALKWTTSFNPFTKSASGIGINEARSIYNAISIPKICRPLVYPPI